MMSMDEEREVYPNAPVVLVALEVRHPVTDPLTAVQRNMIKRRLGGHVPIMRTGQVQQLTVVQPVGGPPVAPELRAEEFPRYFSRDNTAAVSVRAEAVIVETTRYVRWEQMRALIADVLAVRQEIGGVDGVERVGLRYVDEIRVPGGPEQNWAPWMDPTLVGPAVVGDELGLAAAHWQGIGVFTPGPERTIVLRYGPREGFAVDPGGDLKRSPATPGPFFLMDIDSFWTPSEGVPEFDVKALLATCDELHTPARTLFERLITDRLREEVLRHAQ
ncbi:MAG: TIGR04255 family protein [Pseudonocardiaceae bacterium]